MSNSDHPTLAPLRDPIGRRGALKCLAWAGAGGVWTLGDGAPASALLASARAGTPAPWRSSIRPWPDADAEAEAPGARPRDGYTLRHWRAGGLAFWAVSDVNPADLALFQRDLAARTGPWEAARTWRRRAPSPGPPSPGAPSPVGGAGPSVRPTR